VLRAERDASQNAAVALAVVLQVLLVQAQPAAHHSEDFMAQQLQATHGELSHAKAQLSAEQRRNAKLEGQLQLATQQLELMDTQLDSTAQQLDSTAQQLELKEQQLALREQQLALMQAAGAALESAVHDSLDLLGQDGGNSRQQRSIPGSGSFGLPPGLNTAVSSSSSSSSSSSCANSPRAPAALSPQPPEAVVQQTPQAHAAAAAAAPLEQGLAAVRADSLPLQGLDGCGSPLQRWSSAGSSLLASSSLPGDLDAAATTTTAGTSSSSSDAIGRSPSSPVPLKAVVPQEPAAAASPFLEPAAVRADSLELPSSPCGGTVAGGCTPFASLHLQIPAGKVSDVDARATTPAAAGCVTPFSARDQQQQVQVQLPVSPKPRGGGGSDEADDAAAAADSTAGAAPQTGVVRPRRQQWVVPKRRSSGRSVLPAWAAAADGTPSSSSCSASSPRAPAAPSPQPQAVVQQEPQAVKAAAAAPLVSAALRADSLPLLGLDGSGSPLQRWSSAGSSCLASSSLPGNLDAAATTGSSSSSRASSPRAQTAFSPVLPQNALPQGPQAVEAAAAAPLLGGDGSSSLLGTLRRISRGSFWGLSTGVGAVVASRSSSSSSSHRTSELGATGDLGF
jgi:hypothetical protein